MFKYFIGIPVLVVCAAAFAEPMRHCDRSVERAKSAEAFTYLVQIEAAQERHYMREGRYSADLESLDLRPDAPKFFEVESVELNASAQSWSLALRRNSFGSGAREYGAYRVVWTQGGFEQALSELPQSLQPVL